MRYQIGQALWVWSDFDDAWRAAIIGLGRDSYGNMLADTANDDTFRFPPDYQGDRVKRVDSWERWLGEWERDCYLWLIRRELRSVKSLATAQEIWDIIDHHRSPNTEEHRSKNDPLRRTQFYWGKGN